MYYNLCMRLKEKNIHGVILSRRDIGEADRLLTIFSQEVGKIKVIARGSRRIKSRLACQIEPFSHGSFQIVEGKTFYVLTGAQTVCPFESREKDLEVFSALSYICELLDLTFQEEEPDNYFYQETIKILNMVNNEKDKIQIILLYFESLLLKTLGYRPNYHQCLECGAAIREEENFQGSFEGIFCSECAQKGKSLNKNSVKLLRILSKGDIELVAKLNVSPKDVQVIEELIRYFLADILPRAPKSLTLNS